jgi:hypothetical protein
MKLLALPEHHVNFISARGARGRKARWAVRRAMRVRYRRKEHAARKVRGVQRFLRHMDMLRAHGTFCRECMGRGSVHDVCGTSPNYCDCAPGDGNNPMGLVKCNVCFGYGLHLLPQGRAA